MIATDFLCRGSLRPESCSTHRQTARVPAVADRAHDDATCFDASDLGTTPGLGTLSDFSGSSRIYTATLTPSTAFNDRRSVDVWVEAGRLTDMVGTANLAAALQIVITR